MQRVLFGRQWTVGGLSLQLFPWQPCFEASHTKLLRAAVWVQLHNLPVGYWDGDSLETIIETLGKLPKVDEHTETLSRTRFPRICLELDLSKPSERGFWVEDDDKQVFVIVLYEKLPTFYYRCGLVGHGDASCSLRHDTPQGNAPSGAQSGGQNLKVPEIVVLPGEARHQTAMEIENQLPEPLTQEEIVEDLDYGSWMVVVHQCGHGRRRGGFSCDAHVTSMTNTKSQTKPYVEANHGTVSARGRGGQLGQCVSSHALKRCPSSSYSPVECDGPSITPDIIMGIVRSRFKF